MNLLAKKIKLHCARKAQGPSLCGGGQSQPSTHDAVAARTGGGNTAQLLNRTFSCVLFPSCNLLKQSQRSERIVQSVVFVI
jgi:hypothetical protein